MEKSRSPLERGIQIIFYLCENQEPVTLEKITANLGVNESSAYRILETLRKYHLVNHHPDRRGYSLGHAYLQLAERYLANMRLATIAMPVLRELRDKTGETAGVYVAEIPNRVCVARVDSRETVRRTLEVGVSMPLYLGAAGRVLLSYMSPDIIDSVLKPLNGTIQRVRTQVSVASFRKELKQISAQGYAISKEDGARDAWAVATPIRTNGRNVIGAIAITGPISRYREIDPRNLAQMLMKSAEALGANL